MKLYNLKNNFFKMHEAIKRKHTHVIFFSQYLVSLLSQPPTFCQVRMEARRPLAVHMPGP